MFWLARAKKNGSQDDEMTEAEAQEFLAKTIIVFIGQDGEKWPGFREVDRVVYAPDDSGSLFLDDNSFVEELTISQIVAIAGGG